MSPRPFREMRWSKLFLALSFVVASLLVSAQASAQNQLSFDAEAAFPSETAEAAGNDTGFGVGARFGHEWDLVLVEVTPEIGANYHSFGGPADGSAFAVVAGGRVGLGFVIEPSAFIHAGVGHYGYDTPTGEVSQTSLAYEFGLALDLTLLPVIDFGAHAALAGVSGDADVDPFSWLAVGGHITFNLGDSDDDDDD